MTGIERRTRIRSVSKKRATQLRVYRPKRDAFLETHRVCEYPDGCRKPGTELHHRMGRRGSLLLDERFWAAACHEHNQAAETDTGTCLANGWLLRSVGRLPEDNEEDVA